MDVRHPAVWYGFDELVAGLEAARAVGAVTSVDDGPLRLYTYTQQCVYDKLWSPFSLIARGLVLDLEANCIRAMPFPKFFNYGEVGPERLPDCPFEVTEKIDGSLGIVFHDGQRWRVATKGSFKSEQAEWAQRWLTTGVGRDYLDVLCPGHTYLFEIVYPENRIVVSYSFEGLVLLSAYGPNGREYSRRHLEELVADVGERLVRVRSFFGLDDLLAVAKDLSSQEEGFVVRFANGYRVKVKGEEYCRLHRLISRVTPLGVWNSYCATADRDSVGMQLPEEFRKDFEAIWALLDEEFQTSLRHVRLAHEQFAGDDDKTVGLWMQSDAAKQRPSSRFVFAARKHEFLNQVMEDGNEWRVKFCKEFRPTGNRLAGYVPSARLQQVMDDDA